jgi:recombination protein RecT
MSAAKSSASKALEKVDAAAQGKGALTLYEYIERQQGEIARALPRTINMTPEYFVRVALTFAKNPKSQIHGCDVKSVLAGLMEAASLGLTVDGVRGQAYLVPRKSGNSKIATFQIGWKGLVTLAGRSGITVAASAVREGDFLEYQKGSHPRIDHKPSLDGDDDEDLITSFYAVATFPDGRPPAFDIKSRAWMEKFRDQFAARKADNAPWWVHFEAMGRKTMIRRVLGDLPVDVEVRDALARDAEGFQAATPTPFAETPEPAVVDGLDDDIVDAELEEEASDAAE